MAIGFLEFAEGESLAPGEARVMELTLLVRPGLAKHLVPGRRWRIQEGAQLVGHGVVLEVMD